MDLIDRDVLDWWDGLYMKGVNHDGHVWVTYQDVKDFIAAAKTVSLETKVESNVYDIENTYPNCTVQVLENSITGETSVGWWKNE